MLKITNGKDTGKVYPKDVVSSCLDHPNGIMRKNLLPNNPRRNVESGENSHEATLFERDSVEDGQLYNTFDVRNFQMDKQVKNGNLNSYVSLKTPAQKITISADILHTQDGKVLDIIPPVEIENNNYLVLNQDFTLDTNIYGKDIAALVHAMWENEDGTFEELSMLYHLGLRDERLTYEHSRPSIHDHIIIKETPGIDTKRGFATDTKDHIVIALNRVASDMKDVNYACCFGTGANGYPLLGIPAKGEFIMPPNCEPILDGNYAPEAYCVIGPPNGGGKTILQTSHQYQTDCKNMQFTSTGSGLLYDMAYSWGVTFDEKAMVNHEFDYDLKMKFAFKDNETNNTIHCFEMISSANEYKDNAIESIHPLNIMWGCLGIDTLVKMSDASHKKIQDIKIGDRIFGADGQPWLVENTWIGFEERILVVKAGDQTIELTDNHPIKVDGEVIMARELQVGMQAMLESGKAESIVQIEEKVYRKDVYNLDISPINRADDYNVRQHLILANGFVVGDNILQNEMGDKNGYHQ